MFQVATSTRPARQFPLRAALLSLALAAMAAPARAGFTVFESAGPYPASITPTRDAFRAAVGGGTVAGANGDFGGVRTEINWDGVPDARADPNSLPADFFNTTSPRGAVFSTPGTGFLVSANAGGSTPPLFGFSNDFQAFSAQRLFTAVGSPITDVNFFVPGTNVAGTTNAFGVIFVDVEVPRLTTLQFFDENNNLIFSREAMVADNQGLTFLGAVANAGERISRVRITSGANSLLSNGVIADQSDLVVMDDFLFSRVRAVPEPGSFVLTSLGLVGGVFWSRRRRRSVA